jgi:hypothetical protein
MPPSFGDLYKPVKDLLTKKYNGDSHKFDMKTKDGVTFNPVFTRSGDSVSGTVAVEGTYDPCAWAAMKLKYTIATKGNLKTQMTITKMAPGLTVEGNWDAALGDDVTKDTYDAKATYKQDVGNCEAKIAKSAKATTADVSGVYGVLQDLSLGANVNYDIGGKKQNSMALAAAYVLSKQTTAAGTLTRSFKDGKASDSLKAGFCNKGSPYVVAAEYSAALADPKKGVITVGCETKLENGQIVKAKADSKGALGFSLQHSLSSQLAFCSSMELTPGEGGKYGSKFGTELVYSS